MTEAYIYDAARTPRGKGKKDGALYSVKPVDLVVGLLKALETRNRLDTAQVDDVVLGCVTPVGDQGADIAKTAVLAADWAECVAGVQLNRYCGSGLEAVSFAAAKVMAASATVAAIRASQAKIAESGLLIMAVVMLHNSFGYLLGYFTGRLFKLPLAQRKSLALEVGMQNSGLASALALMYFTAAGGIAGAIFSVWHNISGSIFASYCMAKDERKEQEEQQQLGYVVVPESAKRD